MASRAQRGSIPWGPVTALAVVGLALSISTGLFMCALTGEALGDFSEMFRFNCISQVQSRYLCLTPLSADMSIQYQQECCHGSRGHLRCASLLHDGVVSPTVPP
jgi:hypothetical protein